MEAKSLAIKTGRGVDLGTHALDDFCAQIVEEVKSRSLDVKIKKAA